MRTEDVRGIHSPIVSKHSRKEKSKRAEAGKGGSLRGSGEMSGGRKEAQRGAGRRASPF